MSPPQGKTSGRNSGKRSRGETIARLRRLARLLDARFGIPGTRWRVGLDGLLGLAPGVGDTITAALSAYLILEAVRLDAPRGVIGRMIANVAIDYVVGTIPIAGDLFDVAWKANTRNLDLLERYLLAESSDNRERPLSR